jgi:hypothetical protein
METPHKGVLLGTLVCTIKLEQEKDTSRPNHSQEWGTSLGMEIVFTTWKDHIYKMAEKACIYLYAYVHVHTYTYIYIHMCIIYRQDTSCKHKHLYHWVLKNVFERRWTLCLLLQELQGLGRGKNFNNGQNRTWDLTGASTVLLRTSTEPALFGVRWYKVPFLSSSWSQICW